jgi:hypothetical protein
MVGLITSLSERSPDITSPLNLETRDGLDDRRGDDPLAGWGLTLCKRRWIIITKDRAVNPTDAGSEVGTAIIGSSVSRLIGFSSRRVRILRFGERRIVVRMQVCENPHF